MTAATGAALARADLPPLRAVGRADRIRPVLGGAGVDALVLTDPADVRWLSGFTGSAGRIVLTDGDAVLVTDGRYAAQAEAELAAAGAEVRLEVAAHEEQPAVLAALLGTRRVGVDPATLTWSDARELETLAGSLHPIPEPVAGPRAVKTGAEVARVRLAAALTDASLAEVVAEIEAPGRTELEIARRLDRGMQDRGADGPGYPTIVGSGPNAALPHARPGDRRLADGDTVVVDVGAEVDGYRSDMTRTFGVGRAGAGDRDAGRWDAAVREAQAAGIAAVRPGVTGREIDRAAREVIVDHGFGDAFTHGIGHGVGLVIHEMPILSRSEVSLEPGMLVTVEPGVYLPGRGGVRWEDLLLVTSDGAEPLTRSPKPPLVRF